MEKVGKLVLSKKEPQTSVLACSIPVVESKQVYCLAWDLFFWEAGHLQVISTLIS